jgi:hypothetical protein
MLPKKGKKLHSGSRAFGDGGSDDPFEQAIAIALRTELGLSHRAVKTVMIWTGASERTVKHWFAGTHGPSGRHLIHLARHSDAVLSYFFLSASDRPFLTPGIELVGIRAELLDLVEVIDRYRDGKQWI